MIKQDQRRNNEDQRFQSRLDSPSLNANRRKEGSYGIGPKAKDSPMPKDKVGRWETCGLFISFLSRLRKHTGWRRTWLIFRKAVIETLQCYAVTVKYQRVPYGMAITVLPSLAWSACNNHYKILPHGKAATEIYRILEMTRGTRVSQTVSKNDLGLVWDVIKMHFIHGIFCGDYLPRI
jgi:hypothetical protein